MFANFARRPIAQQLIMATISAFVVVFAALIVVMQQKAESAAIAVSERNLEHEAKLMAGMLDSIAEDMAMGQGEALDAYATLLGVEAQDRAHFAKVTHDNFGSIFSQADATSEQVLAATLEVMSRDAQLARYVKQPA